MKEHKREEAQGAKKLARGARRTKEKNPQVGATNNGEKRVGKWKFPGNNSLTDQRDYVREW